MKKYNQTKWESKEWRRNQIRRFYKAYGNDEFDPKMDTVAKQVLTKYTNVVTSPVKLPPPQPTFENVDEAHKTIKSLESKVIEVLEEGLDDPKYRYDVALGVAKYLFPQHKAANSKVEQEIKVTFQNLTPTTKQLDNAPDRKALGIPANYTLVSDGIIGDNIHNDIRQDPE